jgi:hypothetical protein
MINGAMWRRRLASRPRWSTLVIWVAGMIVVVGLFQTAISLLAVPERTDAVRLGHPNTRPLVLPVLPRP